MRIKIPSDQLTCPVTKKLFVIPVSLQCGHLVEESCASAGMTCPVCSTKTSSVSNPVSALKAIMATKLNTQPESDLISVEVKLLEFKDTVSQEYISEPVITSCGHVNELNETIGLKQCPTCRAKDITFSQVNPTLQHVINLACESNEEGVNYLEDQYCTPDLIEKRADRKSVDNHLLRVIKNKNLQKKYTDILLDQLEDATDPQIYLELVDRALTIDPGETQYLYLKAAILNLLGRYKESLDITNSLVVSGKSESYIYAERGYAKLMLNIEHELAEDFDAAIVNTAMAQGMKFFFKKLYSGEPEAKQLEVQLQEKLKWQYPVIKALYTLKYQTECAEALALLGQSGAPSRFEHEIDLVKGIAHVGLRQPEPAFACMERVLKSIPDNISARFYRGMLTLVVLNKPEEALADLKAAGQRNRQFGIEYLYRAKRLCGYLVGALVDINDMILEDPHDISKRLERARLLYEMQRQEEAQADLDFIINSNPEDISALIEATFNRAEHEYEKLHLIPAMEYVTKAIDLDKEVVGFYLLRANIYLRGNELVRCEADLNYILNQLKPTDTEKCDVYFLLAHVHLLQRNYDAVLAETQACLTLLRGKDLSEDDNITFCNCLIARSTVYRKQGYIDKANDELNEILKLKVSTSVYIKIATVLKNTENYEYVISLVNIVDPERRSPELTRLAAQAYIAMGQFDLALSMQERAILAQSLQERATTLEPMDMLLLYVRAGIFYEQRNYERAIADLTTVLDMNERMLTDNHSTIKCSCYFFRSKANKRLNKLDLALSDIVEALKIAPVHEGLNGLKRDIEDAIQVQKTVSVVSVSTFKHRSHTPPPPGNNDGIENPITRSNSM